MHPNERKRLAEKDFKYWFNGASDYKPKTHDLQKLKELVTSVEPEFLKVFPQGTQTEKDRFELLRKAYVSARYNRDYQITPEDLAWLVERVNYLKALTDTLCREKIATFVPTDAP